MPQKYMIIFNITHRYTNNNFEKTNQKVKNDTF
jgi:hypothetical protein